MRAQVKPTKTEKILLTVTAVFICLLLGLMLYGKATGAQGHYTVTAEKSAASSSEPAASASSAIDAAPININTATAEALASLPGIGDTLAKRIVDYRAEHGPFSAKEEIQKVSGIGEKTFEEIADRITVEG